MMLTDHRPGVAGEPGEGKEETMMKGLLLLLRAEEAEVRNLIKGATTEVITKHDKILGVAKEVAEVVVKGEVTEAAKKVKTAATS